MDELPPLPEVLPGRYRHYKGGEYELIGVARHSETLEPLVVYRPLYGDGGLWVRPYAMFFGEVEVEGQRRPRFAALLRCRASGDPGLPEPTPPCFPCGFVSATFTGPGVVRSPARTETDKRPG